MRWERLFDDLEARWGEEERAASRAEIADRTRRELATVTLVSRLAGQEGPVELLLPGGRRLCAPVGDLGDGFVVLTEGTRRWLVPLGAIVQVTGLPRRSAGPRVVTRVRRFGLGAALRAIARDRAGVVVDDRAGRQLTGSIDAVGADHVDIVEHPLDVPRRPEAVQALRVLPFDALICVSAG